MMLLQDIHYTDNEFWTELQNCWADENYARALNLLESNQELTSKYVNSAWFNLLANSIYTLETQSDPSFKSNKIQVGYELPTVIQNGEIFYEIGVSNLNTYQSLISVGKKTTTIEFDGVFLNALALQNNAIVQVEIEYNNNSVKFVLGEKATSSVTCVVYTTILASEYVSTNFQTLDSNNLTRTVTIPSNQQLISWYCVKNNQLVQIDVNYLNNQLMFAVNSDSITTGEQIKCYYITMTIDNFPFIVKDGSIEIDSSITSLSYNESIISVLNYINKNTLAESFIILTDCTLSNNQIIISLLEPTDEQIKCSIIY